MSSKSSKGPKKINLPKETSTPRQLPEIEAEYGRLVAQLGQANYQVFVFNEDIKRMNEQLRNLNYEAAARQELNKQKPETEEQKAVSNG